MPGDRTSREELLRQKAEANSCMALGAGVGALGLAAAALTGAVCPLCYFVAPGLLGVGLFQRQRIQRQERRHNKAAEQTEKIDAS